MDQIGNVNEFQSITKKDIKNSLFSELEHSKKYMLVSGVIDTAQEQRLSSPQILFYFTPDKTTLSLEIEVNKEIKLQDLNNDDISLTFYFNAYTEVIKQDTTYELLQNFNQPDSHFIRYRMEIIEIEESTPVIDIIHTIEDKIEELSLEVDHYIKRELKNIATSTKQYYACPNCDAYHTTNSWTENTRMKLGIGINSGWDIIHLDEKRQLKDSNNFFYCPSCNEIPYAKDIYKYDNEVTQPKREKLKQSLKAMEISKKKDKAFLIKDGIGFYLVHYDNDSNSWFICDNTLDDDRYYDKVNGINEVIDYALLNEIIVE